MIKNEHCIEAISNNLLLRDKIIKKIEFAFEKQLSILFYIAFQEDSLFILILQNVKSYCLFSDQPDDNGYLITHYKIFKNKGLFYFSFDPYTEDQRIEEEDNNYIYAEEVFGDIISAAAK